MSTYGVTPNGFVVKPLSVIKGELEADLRAEFGADVNLDAREPLGQLVGVMAERFSEAWDLAEAIYRAADPDGATGDGLEAIAALTGTRRAPATRSEAQAVLAGATGTIVPAGSAARSPSNGARWSLRSVVTLAAVMPWAGATTYAAGDRRANSGELYEVVTGGASAASGGPSGTGTSIVDGAVTWRWIGSGAAAADGVFDADDTGPIQALARALSEIATPVSGWSTVLNLADATLGHAVESDEELRVRREQGLRAVGAAALDAIRADIVNLPGVTACTVFENTTASVDGDGLPAKSIEVLVSGGVDHDIRAAIWRSKAGGIETYGNVSGTTTDSQGVARTVKFSRPVDKLVYLDVSIKIDAATFPADGDAQVQAALAAKTYAPGDDVVSWALKKLVGVSGVTDVPALKVGLAAWPTTETTLAIGSRELAKLSTSRIRITHV